MLLLQQQIHNCQLTIFIIVIIIISSEISFVNASILVILHNSFLNYSYRRCPVNQFEKRQLRHLRRVHSKPYYPGFVFVCAVVIVLTRITNELSTNLSTYIQSSVVTEFFVTGDVSYEEALSKYTLLSLVISSFTMCSIFYKPLADVLGRKAVLIINAIGLTVGMVLCSISSNVFMYLIGVATYSFFTQNDLQMVYILEVAPKGRGTSYFGIIKALGILGMVLVPILRDTVMQNNPELWRSVYLIPAVICLVICFASVLFLRESKDFTQKRLAYLEAEPQSRNAERNSGEQAGIFKAIRYICTHRGVLAAVIAYMFYGMCSMAAYSYVESIMSTNGMSAGDVTQALYVYPFVYAALSFLGGVLSDRIGRKPVVVTTGFLVAIGFVLFLTGCKQGWNPHLIGFLNGIYLGSYFVSGDYLSVMLLEKVPAGIRGSIMGGAMLLMTGGCFLGIAYMMVLMTRFGLNVAALTVIVPFVLISTLIVLFAVKETHIAESEE